MSLSSRDFSSFLLLLYWNSRVCLATVRNWSSLKPLCIRQTSVQNDLWASWNALYSPFVKGYKKYFLLYGIALFFYLVGPDPPSSNLPGSQFYSFYSIPPFSHLGGSDSEMLPKPTVLEQFSSICTCLLLTSGSGSIIPSIFPSLLISNSNPVVIQLSFHWGKSESTNLSSSAPGNESHNLQRNSFISELSPR